MLEPASAALDHLVVLCAPGAPEAAALTREGFSEGSPNLHPGQGTACRRFFFDNAYLELLWVAEPEEAQRDPVRATGLWDHWSRRSTGACPFGLALRPAHSAETAGPPFATWPYQPLYLPPTLSIDIALSTTVEEPLLFYLGFQRGPGQVADAPASPQRRDAS